MVKLVSTQTLQEGREDAGDPDFLTQVGKPCPRATELSTQSCLLCTRGN